jgi:Xaa-Pro aminopeptidase
MDDIRSAPQVFQARREQLGSRFAGSALFVSGFARPRNFPANRYRYRAESHFLYLIGAHVEGAALVVHGTDATLYADPAHPDEALWVGPSPSLAELSATLGIAVRPLDELSLDASVATLPAQDADTARWQSDLVGRDVEPGGGDELGDRDAALADAMIAIRLRHDDAAIAQLRMAADVTAAAHEAGMRATRSGLTEARVRACMEAAIVRWLRT